MPHKKRPVGRPPSVKVCKYCKQPLERIGINTRWDIWRCTNFDCPLDHQPQGKERTGF
jgi:hypothetical protein